MCLAIFIQISESAIIWLHSQSSQTYSWNRKLVEIACDFKKGGGAGIYTLLLTDPVSAEQKTDGGGWTVFQRRLDGSVDFYREWADYKEGFGTAGGEYWLGLDNIHRLTNQGRMLLRVDLSGKMLQSAHALYRDFVVSSDQRNYTLGLGSYTGQRSSRIYTHSTVYLVTLLYLLSLNF